MSPSREGKGSVSGIPRMDSLLSFENRLLDIVFMVVDETATGWPCIFSFLSFVIHGGWRTHS